MSEPTETMRRAADVIDHAGVCPVKVQVTKHSDETLVDVHAATRTDLFALCDATGTRHPAAAERSSAAAGDGQLHYSVITKAGWLLRCVSFPHHLDRLEDCGVDQ